MRATLRHPLSAQGVADPYPVYAAFRRITPAFYDAGMGMWLLTSHRLCRTALTDSSFSAAQGQQQRLRADPLPVSMLNTDGALHARLRSPAAGPLSARSVARKAAAIDDAAAATLAALPGAGSNEPIDAIADVAMPFALAVLGTAIGLERQHWPRLGALAGPASANLNPMIVGAAADAARLASTQLNRFLAEHSARLRSGSPPSDLLGLPLDVELDPAERAGIFSLMIVGGYEPLALLLGNALNLLLDLPEMTERLRGGGDGLLLGAVDEALRMETPIPFTARVCVTGMRIGDVELAPGARVLTLLGAANRDPEVFDRPDIFDPTRAPNPHLGFGAGAHFCLGAPLVRRATATMLGLILRERPALRRALDSCPDWRPAVIPRGLTSLPVLW